MSTVHPSASGAEREHPGGQRSHAPDRAARPPLHPDGPAVPASPGLANGNARQSEIKPRITTGLIAAPFTPFGPDGRLAPAMIPRLAQNLAADGIAGAFICGTTGEGASLTLEERQEVTEAWMKARPRGFAVIAHVGHNCLADACELAHHAAQQGADGIGMMAPGFFRPTNLDDLVASCATVAAAAPQLPYYYYHFPSMNGVDFPMAALLTLAAQRIPNFAGIKFTDANLLELGRAITASGGRFTVFHGRDELLLDGLALGVTAAVGSTYNYLGPLFNRMIAAFEAGDTETARREQAAAVRIIEVMLSYGFAGNKAIMRLIGLDCGPVRLPLHRLDSLAEERLRKEMDAAGLAAARAVNPRLAA